MTESKNKAVLDEFILYCREHNEERFWQAARNFAGVPFLLFGYGEFEEVFSVGKDGKPKEGRPNLRDTFFFHGRIS